MTFIYNDPSATYNAIVLFFFGAVGIIVGVFGILLAPSALYRVIFITIGLLGLAGILGGVLSEIQGGNANDHNDSALIHAAKKSYGITLSRDDAENLFSFNRSDDNHELGTTSIRTAGGVQKITLYQFDDNQWVLGLPSDGSGKINELPKA